jgi:hypothetical protein
LKDFKRQLLSTNLCNGRYKNKFKKKILLILNFENFTRLLDIIKLKKLIEKITLIENFQNFIVPQLNCELYPLLK